MSVPQAHEFKCKDDFVVLEQGIVPVFSTKVAYAVGIRILVIPLAVSSAVRIFC